MQTTATVRQALLDKQKALIDSTTSLKELAFITKAFYDSQKVLSESGLVTVDTNQPYGSMYDATDGMFYRLGHGVPVVQQTMRRVVCNNGSPRLRPPGDGTPGTIHRYLSPTNSNLYEDGSSAVADIQGANNREVFVEIRRFYVKKWVIADQNYKVISLVPFEGAETDPLFRLPGWTAGANGTDPANEVPFHYLSAFERVLWDADKAGGAGYIEGTGDTNTSSLVDLANDRLRSVAGFRPWTGLTRAQNRTLIGLSNSKQYNIHEYNAISLLFETEYLTNNIQSVVEGYTEDASFSYAADVVRTGTTLSLGNRTGSISGRAVDFGGTDTTTRIIGMSYRGIENIFGHLWQWMDGVNVNSGQLWIAPFVDTPFGDNQGSDINYVRAKDINGADITLPTTSNSYISRFHDGTYYARSVFGNSANAIGDNYWYDTGWRVVPSGGYLNYGRRAGLATWFGFSSSSVVDSVICSR